MNKRRDKNIDKLQKVCDKHNYDIKNIYCKEKRGGFDVTPMLHNNEDMFNDISEIENESYNMCETCWKTSKQFWFNYWWVTHHCFKHYIIIFIKNRFRKLRNLWNKIYEYCLKSI